MLHEAITEDIIGAAMVVLNALGPGLDEKVYERALVIELAERGHRIQQQRSFRVFYHGQCVGTHIPDLIVDELVIVDTKVVSAFVDTHVAKMRGYLQVAGLEVALLLNFKESRLQWKRVTTLRTGKTEQPLIDPGPLDA